jgi:hypothetical protein
VSRPSDELVAAVWAQMETDWHKAIKAGDEEAMVTIAMQWQVLAWATGSKEPLAYLHKHSFDEMRKAWDEYVEECRRRFCEKAVH